MTLPASIDEMEFEFRLAEQARRAGKFRLALDRYLTIISRRQAALAQRSRSQMEAADIVVLERTAELAVLFGHDEGADSLLAGMASALESGSNFFGADYTVIKRIHLALNFGRLKDAQKLFRTLEPRIGDVRSIVITEAGLDDWESSCRWPGTKPSDRTVIFAFLYLVLGSLLSSLGRYRDALLMLRRGLHFTAPDAPNLARHAAIPLQLTIVTALIEQGNLVAARNQLDALQSVNKTNNPGFYVRLLELDAKMRMLQGDFGGALKKYSEVRSCCKQYAFSRAEYVAILNLSNALIFLNHISAAQQLLLSVLDGVKTLREQAVLSRAERLLALANERSASFEGNVAVTPPQQRQRPAAPVNADAAKAFADVSQSADYLSLFEDRVLEFHWYLANRNLTMAREIVRHLTEAFGLSDSWLIHARLKVIKGALEYYEGNFVQSECHLRQSLGSLEEIGLRPDLWQAQRILGWCWARLGIAASAYQRLIESNQHLLATMTESLPPGYQSVFLLNKWTADEEFIAGEVVQLEHLRTALAAKPWFRKPLLRWSLMKRIYSLQQYVDRFRHSLTRQENDRNEAQKAPSLWSFLRRRRRDRVTISYLVLPDRVVIIYAGWMKLDFEVAPVSRITIRQTVRRWHVLVNHLSAQRGETSAAISQDYLLGDDYLDQLLTGRNLRPAVRTSKEEPALDEANRIAESLAHLLQLPAILSRLPSRVRSLTIIPHDSLLGFPFAAVRQQGRYLIERFDLNVDVGFLEREESKASPAEARALFVGVSAGVTGFSRLPGVLREIGTLEQWCRERGLLYESLIDGAATKAAVVDHLNDACLLHIASHGVFRADQPDASGLVLTSPTNHINVLSLRDLSALDLGNLRHVSLSSCSSADNFICPGRWVIGLPETLRRRGVGSVLACLWAINDRFATAFAARFYEYVNSYRRDEALRLTQLDCLHQAHHDGQVRPLENVEGIDTADPSYWASYILCGDPNRLKL